MSVDRVTQLTSSEAGFFYAWRRFGASNRQGWEVDETTATPLTELIDAVAADREGLEIEDTEIGQLLDGRFVSWWRRHGEEELSQRQRAVERCRCLLDEQGPGSGIPIFQLKMARDVIREEWERHGGDLSIQGERYFDLRCLLEDEGEHTLSDRLIVVGALLVSTLKSGSLRRRLAANLRRLSPTVSEEIRSRLEVERQLESSVERRVYELYRRVTQEAADAHDEFILVGLYFLTGAAVFRQHFGLLQVRRRLCERLSRWLDYFQAAWLRSGKPELSPAIARTLHEILTERKEDNNG